MKLAHQTQPAPKERFDVSTKGYVDDIGGKQIEVMDFANRVSHNSDAPLLVGAFAFNLVDHDRAGLDTTVAFRAVAAMGDVSLGGSVKLVNVTDAEDVATLTIGGTALTKYEQVLTLGPGTGEIDLLNEHVYEVQIFLNAPPTLPTHTIELYSAELRVVNLVP